jgi:hypothetical protein
MNHCFTDIALAVPVVDIRTSISAFEALDRSIGFIDIFPLLSFTIKISHFPCLHSVHAPRIDHEDSSCGGYYWHTCSYAHASLPKATIDARVVIGTTTALPSATAAVNKFLGITFVQSPPERFYPPCFYPNRGFLLCRLQRISLPAFTNSIASLLRLLHTVLLLTRGCRPRSDTQQSYYRIQ